MKELLKIMPKKLFMVSFIIGLIYSVADYGQSYALSYFGTNPLTLNKIIKKHYFNKMQSMTMEQQSNTHTGYVYKLISNVSQYFFDSIWFFETSVIPEFILQRGDKISIMGESGQGKTTVMNILPGLYPLENGKLLINNKEIEDTRLDLVFVSQEVELFDLSIRDNLCLGKEISDDRILELLEEAGLTGWYNELPEGLETIVGEKGIKLSVGQKQRLNLIRGILIDKELYFFDETYIKFRCSI